MARHHIVLLTLAFAAFASTGLTGCACHHAKKEAMAAAPAVKKSSVLNAVAIMRPTRGNHVHGKITFTEEFGKVKIEGTLMGLPPNSKHGFHVHEFGDCTAPDGSSAGGHYNPMHEPHGSLEGPHHAGDLGNIVADRRGRAHISLEIPDISLNGDENPIIGRSLIVHKDADDMVSQPAGNAGARLACGVIGAANEPKK